MATTDDHGLSEMREEHRPRREIDGKMHALRWLDRWSPTMVRDCFAWVAGGVVLWCHPDDAHQSIDAARRKALRDAGWEVVYSWNNKQWLPISTSASVKSYERDPMLSNGMLKGAANEPEALRAAYAAVFPKEPDHGE